MVPVADLFDREQGLTRDQLPDLEEFGGTITLPPVLDAEIARRLVRTPLEILSANMRAQHDHDLTNAFDAGRAYERGATLRRGVGKSIGSRRVQAQGIAGDYLRDDPEQGALHAAMVLAGFTGADPATVTL
jgi:hypothetical protein